MKIIDTLYVSFTSTFGHFLMDKEFRNKLKEEVDDNRAYFAFGIPNIGNGLEDDPTRYFYQDEEQGYECNTEMKSIITDWKEVYRAGSYNELRQLYKEFIDIIKKADTNGKVLWNLATMKPENQISAIASMLGRDGYTIIKETYYPSIDPRDIVYNNVFYNEHRTLMLPGTRDNQSI